MIGVPVEQGLPQGYKGLILIVIDLPFDALDQSAAVAVNSDIYISWRPKPITLPTVLSFIKLNLDSKFNLRDKMLSVTSDRTDRLSKKS